MARRARKSEFLTVQSSVGQQPKVVALICNWQSKDKKPIDITSKSYSTDVKFLRVMCASRIDRAILLKCVEQNVDGIFIGICNSEKCRYRGGNELAKNRFQNTIDLLNNIGYERSRIFVYEDDGASDNTVPRVLNEFTQKIKQLGLYQK